MSRRALAVTLIPLLLATGCLFGFDRSTELSPGEVAGRAVLPDGSPAAYARVVTEGRARITTADADGRFLVPGYTPGAWAVRIEHDADGDGRADFAAVRTFAISVEAHATGLIGEDAPLLSWVLLGDVELGGAVSIQGQVQNEFGTPVAGAEVYAYRRHELPGAELGDGLTVAAFEAEGEVEAKAGTDETGRYRLEGLAPGRISLVAFGPSQNPPEVSSALFVNAAPDDALSAGDLSPLVIASGATARDAQIELDRAPDSRVKVVLVPAGEPLPEQAFASFDEGDVFPAGQRSLPVRPALGVWDVYVVTDDLDAAVLRRRVADREGEPLILWGTTKLSENGDQDTTYGFACTGLWDIDPIDRDCDSDGLPALPFLTLGETATDPDREVWGACIATCSAGERSCAEGDDTWDCDDDGDGQPDVTEPFECTTLSAGNDRDGDFLCEMQDRFPQCSENRAQAPACEFTAPPLTGWPPAPPAYEGRVCASEDETRRVSFVNDGESATRVELFEDDSCRLRVYSELNPNQAVFADARLGSEWRFVDRATGAVLLDTTITADGDRVFFADGTSNAGDCTTLQGGVTNFTVENVGNSPVYLTWMNFRCGFGAPFEIAPGQAISQTAAWGYMWRVYPDDTNLEDDEPLLELVLTEGESTAFTVSGPDAGPLPLDAGSDDGGQDAGADDAGTVDAGVDDAGPVDAGPVDAGPVDAGPTDAGPTDAGTTDAG